MHFMASQVPKQGALSIFFLFLISFGTCSMLFSTSAHYIKRFCAIIYTHFCASTHCIYTFVYVCTYIILYTVVHRFFLSFL